MHTDEGVTRTEYKFTLYDTVAILNVCSTRSTKAPMIMLSDSCNDLRTHIYQVTACEDESKFTLIRTDYSIRHSRNNGRVQYEKHKGVHHHAE